MEEYNTQHENNSHPIKTLSKNANPGKYLRLFTSTFYISAFTFGGGFVIVPLLKKKFVDELKWVEEEEMLDLIAIAQSSPGAIAVNASILIGYRTAGLLGAMTTVIGTILPPLIILTVISMFYVAFRNNVLVNAVLKGMQSGVAAVIVDVVFNMGNSIFKEKKIASIVVMFGAFIATYFFKINILYIISICIFWGVVTTLFTKRKESKEQ